MNKINSSYLQSPPLIHFSHLCVTSEVMRCDAMVSVSGRAEAAVTVVVKDIRALFCWAGSSLLVLDHPSPPPSTPLTALLSCSALCVQPIPPLSLIQHSLMRVALAESLRYVLWLRLCPFAATPTTP